MANPKLLAYGEFNGAEWSNVRVTLPSKIALERASRANRWTTESHSFTTAAFLSWHAAKLAGHLDPGLEFDTFVKTATDAGVLDEADAAALDDAEDPSDPTQ